MSTSSEINFPKTPNGGPAFPYNYSRQAYGSNIRELIVSEGMTLRDWFAGMALQGLMSQEDERTCPQHRMNDVDGWRKELHLEDAKSCFEIADAMLERRLK